MDQRQTRTESCKRIPHGTGQAVYCIQIMHVKDSQIFKVRNKNRGQMVQLPHFTAEQLRAEELEDLFKVTQPVSWLLIKMKEKKIYQSKETWPEQKQQFLVKGH